MSLLGIGIACDNDDIVWIRVVGRLGACTLRVLAIPYVYAHLGLCSRHISSPKSACSKGATCSDVSAYRCTKANRCSGGTDARRRRKRMYLRDGFAVLRFFGRGNKMLHWRRFAISENQLFQKASDSDMLKCDWGIYT